MDRFVNLAFHIDTNRINARCGLPWMNRTESLGLAAGDQAADAFGDGLQGATPGAFPP